MERGKDCFKARDLFADERCTQPILDFLRNTKVGRRVEPRKAREEAQSRHLEQEGKVVLCRAVELLASWSGSGRTAVEGVTQRCSDLDPSTQLSPNTLSSNSYSCARLSSPSVGITSRRSDTGRRGRLDEEGVGRRRGDGNTMPYCQRSRIRRRRVTEDRSVLSSFLLLSFFLLYTQTTHRIQAIYISYRSI